MDSEKIINQVLEFLKNKEIENDAFISHQKLKEIQHQKRQEIFNDYC